MGWTTMGSCADAVADICYRFVSDQIIKFARLKTNTLQEHPSGRRQILRFKDKDFLDDWNSHTLYVRMRNLYPGDLNPFSFSYCL